MCFVTIGLFLLGTAYIWRGVLLRADSVSSVPNIPAIRYADIQDNKEKIPEEENNGTIEQCNNENCNENEDVFAEEAQIKNTDKIPGEINLDVPFTSQAPEGDWSQPWQDACEEAAVLMLDAYYKEYGLSPLFAKDELVKMVDWEEGVHGWGRSIELTKIQAVYEWFAGERAQKTEILENPTVDELKQFIANGHPVLVVADGKVLPNPHFQNGGPEYHALIIRGYTEDSFITNDPGTRFGENFVYAYDDLMNAIRDWNGGDVKSGRRVVLVAK